MDKERIKIDNDLIYGKVPPQALELEQAVIGALMLEQDAITKVDIEPEIFYKDSHQTIFKIIKGLDKKGKNIDLITVTTELKNQGLLDEVGGPAEITKLTRDVASAAHLEQHIEDLYQYYLRRELIRINAESMQLAYDYSTDLDDIIKLYESSVNMIDRTLIGKHTGRKLPAILNDLALEIERRAKLKKQGGLTGINTGFGKLNKYTSGWQPGWMIVFAARPAMGKTAIAVNRFAKEAALTGKWVNIFSLEMDDISLTERLIIGASGIDTYKIKHGDLTKEDWDKFNHAHAELRQLPIIIDDSPFAKISHMRNVARANKRKGECDLIIIDYLQLADSGTNKYNRNREQEVGEMSRRLKALAKELSVPVIVVCQLSREPERRTNKRPLLSDLRESGAIEQDADLVIFPFRPSYYEITQDEKGESVPSNQAILIIAKNRHGVIGDIVFYHNETMTDFSDLPMDITHLSFPNERNVQYPDHLIINKSNEF
jgi:replicative DNA helicase